MSQILLARYAGGTAVPVAPVVPGALPLSVQREDGGSGSVLVSNGVWLPASGPFALAEADVGKVALFDNGVEVSCWVEALKGRHPGTTNVKSLLVQRTGNPSTWGAMELRFGTPAVATRLARATPPRTPAAYFVASASHLCTALGAPHRWQPVSVSAIDTWKAQWDTINGADKRAAFDEWFLLDDSVNFSASQVAGGGRNALYDRSTSAVSYGARTADATYWYKALSTLNNGPMPGTAGNFNYVQSLVDNNLSFVGSEFMLSAAELLLPYWVSGSDDYVTALRNLAKQVYEIERLDRPNAGTLYNLGNGGERSLARSLEAANVIAHLGETATAAIQFGTAANGQLINAAQMENIVTRALQRNVSGTATWSTLIYSKGGDLIRGTTDTAKARINTALPQRDTVANGQVDITIPVQEITIPGTASMANDGADRICAVILSWDGTQVVATPTTPVTYAAAGSPDPNSGPFRGLVFAGNDNTTPNVPAGHRYIGHVVIRANAVGFTPGTTALTTHGSTVSGITTWYYLNERTLGQKSYMVGMTLRALCDYVDWNPSGSNVSNAVNAISTTVASLWANDWINDGTNKHFKYLTQDARKNGYVGGGPAQGDPFALSQWEQLNAIVVYAFAWLAARNRDVTLAANTKTAIDAAYENRADWIGPSAFHKGADQSYSRIGSIFLLHTEATS